MYEDLDIRIHCINHLGHSNASVEHINSSPGRFYSLTPRNKAQESTNHTRNLPHIVEPNSKVHYNIYKSPKFEPLLRQLYPINTLILIINEVF
jgi:hypothetical protein